MNATAARLGMTGTHFANANGLNASSQHVTARDLAILALAINRTYPQYRPIFGTARVIVDGKAVDSFNELLTRYPGTVGMKTGFLCSAGRNIVTLTERKGRRIMVVLLGATTNRERAERAAKLTTMALSGELRPTGKTLRDLANRPNTRPEDMRMRLCTSQGNAYVAKREALYPMGIGNHKSYLTAARAPRTYTIHTWAAKVPVDVPVPPRKPAFL